MILKAIGTRTRIGRSRWTLFLAAGLALFPRRHRTLLLASVVSGLLMNAAPAQATTLTVTSGNDSGAGTLRQAILDASSGDTINFVTGLTTINLASGELLINKHLTISGPGANVLTVQRSTAGGTSQFRIFDIPIGYFNVTISGLGIANGIVADLGGGGIFNQSSGTLTIARCTISGNTASGGSGGSGGGGGIFNDGGPVTITNSTISRNAASGRGGGISNGVGGPVTITNSTISGNTADGGGGIDNEFSAVNLVDSTISGNTASSSFGGSNGGGIYNDGGTVTITNSTISGNTANGGGGIDNEFSASAVNLVNSTISGNTASNSFGGSRGGVGGGILNTGTVNLTSSTISGNTASSSFGGSGVGGGIDNGVYGTGGTVNLTSSTISDNSASNSGGGVSNQGVVNARNTITAKNTAPNGPDVGGALTSYGFNLIGNNSGSMITPTTGDQIGTPDSPIDPLLGQLADNGGPTKTQALLSGSPAINVGGPSAPARDQRGYVRPDAADIGAFEFGGLIPVTLANISTRAFVQTGDNVMIGGVIITGSGQKKVILRAIGPSLVNFGLPNPLQDPTLELHDHTGAVVAFNDNWMDAPNRQEIIDSGLAPSNNLESAILTTLDPGNYTAIVRGVNNGTGIALVEGYDLDRTAGSKLGNISTRALVQTGDNVMIGGLIITGPDSDNVIVRAIGPSLAQYGITNPLGDPTLELHNGSGTVIGFNDNWMDAPNRQEIIDSGLAPSDNLESAILTSLSPGNYTAIVHGVNNGTGVALVEVYGLN
jgi:hypothetical protein